MYSELVTIAEALSYINSVDYDRFVILTDSRSSLQHIARSTSTIRGTPIAYTILDQILELQRNFKTVKLQWIPSHVGIIGNEKVDSLARRAYCSGDMLSILPYYTDCLYTVKSYFHQLWKEYFDERSKEKGIWYKTIQPEPLEVPWIDNCYLNRRNLVTALRLHSGHIPSKKFTCMMGITPTPYCDHCGIIEDIYHVLMECAQTESLRRRLGSVTNIRHTGWCNSVLAVPSSDEAKKLYKLYLSSLNVS